MTKAISRAFEWNILKEDFKVNRITRIKVIIIYIKF